MGFRTPDRFPGGRREESLTLEDTVAPTQDGELRYVSGQGFRFYEEGVERGLDEFDLEAVDIPYDNVTSGLSAVNVQNAIDEVENRIDTLESTSLPVATQVGQVLYSLDGATFSVQLPIVSCGGWLASDSGVLIVRG